MKTFYTVKGVSEEGVQYLCKNWEKEKTYWIEEKQIRSYKLFSSAKDAKSSLTKLLKKKPEYKENEFSIVTIKM